MTEQLNEAKQKF
jgi:hypothetical protein